MTRHSISFVLPMYNEREGIEDSVEEVKIIARALTDDYEIIVSDDASTDGSPDIVRRMAQADPKVRLVSVSRNTKFGGALANGIKNAQKDVIIYTDSDLPISLFDIKKSLPLIETADIVTAVSKVKKGDTFKRKIISMGYNLLLKMLFNMHVRDVNSGYKVFRRNMLEGMTFISESPFIDAEIFIKAMRKGARIAEYPLIFRPRRQGVSRVARMEVIIRTFTDMLKFRFSRT